MCPSLGDRCRSPRTLLHCHCGVHVTCSCRGGGWPRQLAPAFLAAVHTRGGGDDVIPRTCLPGRERAALLSPPPSTSSRLPSAVTRRLLSLACGWQGPAKWHCLPHLTHSSVPQKAKARNPLRSFRHRGERHGPAEPS